MAILAGLDIGTSSVKLLIVRDSQVLARRAVSYPTHTGRDGEVEQDPQQWWRATCAAFAASGFAGEVDAIGLTGQMQDLIPVTATPRRRPLRNALLYSDMRAATQHARLMDLLPGWAARTGNIQDASTVAAKIAWLREHEPDVLPAAEALLFSSAGYVAWRAGAPAACDVTTASSTGLLDIHRRHWFADALHAAGAEEHQMPRLIDAPQAAQVGEVCVEAAAQLGVRPGTPLVLGMGDAGATTDGIIGSDPGSTYLYLGTTGWIAGVGRPRGETPITLHSLVLPGWHHRLRIGAVQSAGHTAQWARRTFFPGKTWAEVEAAIGSRTSDLSARPLCLPGLGGERTPVRDASYRGAFVGVRESTTPADLYLAALTGVALNLRHAGDDAQLAAPAMPLVGGGSQSPAWRQIMSDVFQATILTGAADDPAALSAVRAAAQALGIPHRIQPVLARSAAAQATTPSPGHAQYASLIDTHRALLDALGPTFRQLSPSVVA